MYTGEEALYSGDQADKTSALTLGLEGERPDRKQCGGCERLAEGRKEEVCLRYTRDTATPSIGHCAHQVAPNQREKANRFGLTPAKSRTEQLMSADVVGKKMLMFIGFMFKVRGSGVCCSCYLVMEVQRERERGREGGRVAARTCAGRSLFWGNTSDIQVLWEVLRLRVHQLWPGSAEYEEGPRAVLTNTVCAAAVAFMLGVLGVCVSHSHHHQSWGSWCAVNSVSVVVVFTVNQSSERRDEEVI